MRMQVVQERQQQESISATKTGTRSEWDVFNTCFGLLCWGPVPLALWFPCAAADPEGEAV